MMAVDFGNVPQWISAVSAVVIVGAAFKLLLHGRRTNIGVAAEPRNVNGIWILDVAVTLTPVGSFRVTPFWPVKCVDCPVPITDASAESWAASTRCDADKTPGYATDDYHPFSKFHRRRRGMADRRGKWGCPNRKVPTIEVREVRVEKADDGETRTTEVPVIYVFNAFHSEFAEPQEQLHHTHAVLIPKPDFTMIGWRVILDVWIPKESWSVRRPESDSWRWQVDDFVPFVKQGAS